MIVFLRKINCNAELQHDTVNSELFKFCKSYIGKEIITMAQTLVNIRMDEELKKNMEQTCQELGMNMTTAITIFAKKMTREKRIPFEVSIDPFYSESNMEHLRRGVEALNAGKGIEHDVIEVD